MTKEQELIKRDLQQADYIGEDGGMVVDGRFTRLGAYRKMIKRYREDTSDTDAEDFKEWCKLENIIPAWFHLLTPERQGDFESDTEWFVSLEKESPFKVWIYWG